MKTPAKTATPYAKIPKSYAGLMALHLIRPKAGDLAKLLGIDASLGYRLLRGERQLTAVQIRKLADSYGLDPAALLE